MTFIQIVEYRTSRFDEGEPYVEEYRRTTEGKRTTTRVRICQDRDDPGHYFTVAEFASYEDAVRNSEMPETTKLSQQLQSLADGPPVFHNLDVIRDES
jgi:hypothetical protein